MGVGSRTARSHTVPHANTLECVVTLRSRRRAEMTKPKASTTVEAALPSVISAFSFCQKFAEERLLFHAMRTVLNSPLDAAPAAEALAAVLRGRDRTEQLSRACGSTVVARRGWVGVVTVTSPPRQQVCCGRTRSLTTSWAPPWRGYSRARWSETRLVQVSWLSWLRRWSARPALCGGRTSPRASRRATPRPPPPPPPPHWTRRCSGRGASSRRASAARAVRAQRRVCASLAPPHIITPRVRSCHAGLTTTVDTSVVWRRIIFAGRSVAGKHFGEDCDAVADSFRATFGGAPAGECGCLLLLFVQLHALGGLIVGRGHVNRLGRSRGGLAPSAVP